MRHSTAVQVKLESGDGWHYANLGSQGGYPLGYCREHPPHPTEAEARKCYQSWLRDHVKLTDRRCSWVTCQVKGCDNPARKIAVVEGSPYDMAVLCETHWTIEAAIPALHLDEDGAGDRWES